jgi:hypothetical protein
MPDNFKNDKPYSLTATYQVTPTSSALTAPYDLHVAYDPNYIANLIDFSLDTEFQFDVETIFTESSTIFASVDTALDVEFSFTIEATYTLNLCIIDIQLGDINFDVDTLFDINHLVGVSLSLGLQYRKAITALSTTEVPWSKPILRVSNEALFLIKD